MMPITGATPYYQQQSMTPYTYTPNSATPAASAVNIQIFEPKAYSAPMASNATVPVYSFPSAPVYNYPETNVYQPQAQPVQQVQPYAQPVQTYSEPVQTPAQQLTQNVPQLQPVANNQNMQTMPSPVITTPQVQNNQQTQETPAQTQNAVVEPQVNAAGENQVQVDVDSLVAGLNSKDPTVQEEAITKIANLSQGEPTMQSAVLCEPVMTGLANIIQQDTSNLDGPSQEQMAALNKAAEGKNLTAEEQTLVENLAPKTMADKNRIISMFTLAMLQKNQRDEIDRYNEAQTDANARIPQPNLQDIIGFKQIENVARSNEDTEVRLGAIQALAFVARPEDKTEIEPIIKLSLVDQEPIIQQAATELLTNIGSDVDALRQEALAETGQQIDISKMSRKERKAYEKELKRQEKEAGKVK